jgi:hypothetical protein
MVLPFSGKIDIIDGAVRSGGPPDGLLLVAHVSSTKIRRRTAVRKAINFTADITLIE